MTGRRLNPRQATVPVVVTPVAGEGSWGEVPGEQFTVMASVTSEQRVVRSGSGEQATAELTLLVMPHRTRDVAAELGPEAWLELPGGQRRQVLAATPIRNRGRLIYLDVAAT